VKRVGTSRSTSIYQGSRGPWADRAAAPRLVEAGGEWRRGKVEAGGGRLDDWYGGWVETAGGWRRGMVMAGGRGGRWVGEGGGQSAMHPHLDIVEP
jgi:hypothetical protein